MKLKVEKQFRDKITGDLRKVGDTFEAEEERAKELLNDFRELVTLVKEDTKESEEKPKAKSKSKKSAK